MERNTADRAVGTEMGRKKRIKRSEVAGLAGSYPGM